MPKDHITVYTKVTKCLMIVDLRNTDNITILFIFKALLSFEARGFLICRPTVSSDTGGW